MHSIRVKFTAVTIAAILVSMFTLGGIGIFSIGMEGEKDSVEKMRLMTENTRHRLDAYMDSVEQSVKMAVNTANQSLSNLDLFLLGSGKSPEDQDRLDQVISDHCDEVEQAFLSIASSTNGIVTYYYCINSDLGSREHGFFWSKVGETDFVQREDLISTDLDINDTEHTLWYYQPLKNGRPVWVGPYTAHYLDEVRTVSYVAPIYRYGFLIGVLGMDILFDTMTSLIDSVTVYDTGFALLLDEEGRMLYHPKTEDGLVPEFVDQDQALFSRLSSGNELIRYRVNGEERQLAFTTLRNKTKLAVSAPVSEIMASRRRLTLRILEVAAILVALFTVVTMLLMNAMTKPLVRLAAASQKLMDGDYSAELTEYNGKDEVGTLTRSFRKMRDYMRAYIADLNSRAYTDALTGVKNKGAFDLSAAQLNSRIENGEQKPAFAFVMFDLDDLKDINDQYGHDRGDIYLRRACSLICRVFAHSPVYRMGGDEFCVLMQADDYAAREALLEAFDRGAAERARTAEHPWERIHVSRGMAVYRPGLDATAEQVLHRADEEMYRDKRRHKEA